MKEKVQMSLDKNKWQPSPLPGHIVFISTVDRQGIPNVAPKSWVSMVAFKPTIIGFGCNLEHQTSRNILETKNFVINVPAEDLVENVWRTAESPHSGVAKLRELGFTLTPSLRVSSPRIQECRAHLECVYDSDKRYGNEIWIFGKIIAVSIDRDAFEGSKRERYDFLKPIFYLEDKTYGTLGSVKKVS